jgi:predicted  nucleic acid-binding Zn-ribbon protein
MTIQEVNQALASKKPAKVTATVNEGDPSVVLREVARENFSKLADQASELQARITKARGVITDAKAKARDVANKYPEFRKSLAELCSPFSAIEQKLISLEAEVADLVAKVNFPLATCFSITRGAQSGLARG